jgi:hypothetical protein
MKMTRLRLLLSVLPALWTLPASAEGAVPRAHHVVLIVGENTSYAQITPRHAPYLTGTLKPQAAWLTNYRSFAKSSSLGQYVAMLSGQYTKCEGNNDTPDRCHQDVPNLLQQLDRSQRTWTDWQESMTNACDWVDHGDDWSKNVSSAHHNPPSTSRAFTAHATTRRSAPGRNASSATSQWARPPRTTRRLSTRPSPAGSSATSRSSFRTTARTATIPARPRAPTESGSSTDSSRANPSDPDLARLGSHARCHRDHLRRGQRPAPAAGPPTARSPRRSREVGDVPHPLQPLQPRA